MKTNTQEAMSKLKDMRVDYKYAIENEDSTLNVSNSDLKNIEYIMQTIKMLESDYERLYDKMVMANIHRAKQIGKENIENDDICQAFIAILKSEEMIK